MSRLPPEEEYLTPRRSTSPMAVFGLVIGGCLVLAVVLVGGAAAILFPVYSSARRAATSASCTSNLKQIATGLMMYSQDYNDQLPPSATWQAEVMPYIKSQQVFACPDRGPAPVGYAYNILLDRRPMRQILSPAATPMAFDSGLGSGADRLESFVIPHAGRGNVAFADGHVKALPTAPRADAGLAPAGKKRPAQRDARKNRK
jgi:prepilin-type processing-associated H-X9-DG protein